MFSLFDRAHRVIAGGVVLGEFSAFISQDRVQAVGFLIAGVATWLSHFVWAQASKRRQMRDDDADSRRRNAVLDALAKKYREHIDAGTPFPYPDLIHLLVDPDDEDDDEEMRATKSDDPK